MHSAMDHDCTLNDRFGKPSCMTEFEQEIREDERERAVQRVEALAWDYTDRRGELIIRAKAIATIKGDQP